jgi:hypothetical protein
MNDSPGVGEASIISTRIDYDDKWVRSTGRKLRHRWYRWYSERKYKLAFIGQLPAVLASAGLLFSNFLFAVRNPQLFDVYAGALAWALGGAISILVLILSSTTMVMEISTSINGEKLYHLIWFEQ